MLHHADDLTMAPLSFIEAFVPAFGRIEPLPANRNRQDAQPVTHSTIKLIAVFCTILDPDMHHDDWFKVGAAIFNITGGSEIGYIAFDNWSSDGDKYKGQRETRKLWSDYKPNHPRPVGVGMLFHYASLAGYRREDVLALLEPFDRVDGEFA